MQILVKTFQNHPNEKHPNSSVQEYTQCSEPSEPTYNQACQSHASLQEQLAYGICLFHTANFIPLTNLLLNH